MSWSKNCSTFIAATMACALWSSARHADAVDDVSKLRRGVLPEKWSSGSPHCSRKSPEFQEHAYNEDFFILRESGCVHDEKPFLYLLFGADKAVLFDTGAGSREDAGKPNVAGAVRRVIAAFLADGKERGHPAPRVVGHEDVVKRFERYRLTNGYNLEINRRQFSGDASLMPEHFLPPETPSPTLTFREQLELESGALRFVLRHARGETDDHLWAFVPEHNAICAGDFFIWNFPNAGNPQKVQRYPLEWAAALRDMAARDAELFIPAHGLPIAGRERIGRVLVDVAGALESLVERTLALMNQGASLDTILHEVQVPKDVVIKPYLLPMYDEPEFVVRNIYRLYGGWYDGNPARLKPARDTELARELSALTGGTAPLIQRARELAAAGELRLACHLIELAVAADPDDKSAHAARYEIYAARRQAEISMMAKGIYGSAANESWQIAFPGEQRPFTRAKGYAI